MTLIWARQRGEGIDKALRAAAEAAYKKAREETARFMREEYEKRKKDRLALELQWTLNANFYAGNQYCDINTHRENVIEQMDPVYEWMERETFNRIMPLVETRTALLQKINYRMTVKPRRNDIDDYAKAEVSSAILSYLQDVSDFDSVKNRAIVWNEICGNCFWVTGWNKSKGQIAAKDADGKIYREGDVEYALLSPYEIYPEDMYCQGVENQRSIMVVQVMSCEEAFDRYGVAFEGKEIERFVITPRSVNYGYNKECAVGVLRSEPKADAVRIMTYYEKPSALRKEGRMVVFADVDDEKNVIYDGKMPYDEIPIAQMVSKAIPGQFFGKSVIEILIPYQRAYNGVKNRMHEYLKRVAIQNGVYQDGSIEDIEKLEETGLPPGAWLKYKQGYDAPKMLTSADLPSEITSEMERLENDMEYIAGVSQLQMVGNTPSGISSGTAIESLQEIDNTRLSITGEYIRASVLKLAKLWLAMYKKYAALPRVIKHTGLNDMGKAVVWCSEDINSFEVEFETENELILSEETQKQNFLQAVQLGFFAQENGQMSQRVKNKVLECMRIGRYSDIMDINGLQLQAAQRENTMMRSGAWCDINEYDDDLIHAEEHKRFILSMEFQVLKYKHEEYAELIVAHWRAHEAREAQKKGEMQNGQAV